MLKQKLDNKAVGVRGSGKVRFLILGGILCLGAGLTFAGYQYMGNKPPAESTSSLISVSKDALDLSITASGTIRPIQEVKISPKQTGLIKRLYVQQGQSVKKGDLIALMDDSNLIGQVESARS
ncbi:MAG TPA: biotin/lipoyl-binding protein, partial [Candidatus Melainabacteria bacterium]|nr:biotin/lipoyl-binding protein [Candidatus Melainabacteria bacterium]